MLCSSRPAAAVTVCEAAEALLQPRQSKSESAPACSPAHAENTTHSIHRTCVQSPAALFNILTEHGCLPYQGGAVQTVDAGGATQRFSLACRCTRGGDVEARASRVRSAQLAHSRQRHSC